MKIVKLKRLWNGLASIRDYTVKEVIRRNDTLRIECNNEYMELTAQEIKDKMFQLSKTPIKSRYGEDYTLIDFPFRQTQRLEQEQLSLI